MAKRAFIALLLLLPVPSIGTAAAMFWWPELPLGKVIFFLTKVWIVVLPLVWLRFVDRSSISWSPARKGGFVSGILSGLLLSAGIVATYFLAIRLNALDATMVTERAAKTGLNQPLVYIAGAIYWITLNSMLEEYVWRWFVFQKFKAVMGGRLAVIASALAFTTHHVIALAAQFNWPVTLLASIGVFIGGATWSWLYERYGSIWPGYVSHAIVDMAIFIIGFMLIFN